jgi:hypothetical protein
MILFTSCPALTQANAKPTSKLFKYGFRTRNSRRMGAPGVRILYFLKHNERALNLWVAQSTDARVRRAHAYTPKKTLLLCR